MNRSMTTDTKYSALTRYNYFNSRVAKRNLPDWGLEKLPAGCYQLALDSGRQRRPALRPTAGIVSGGLRQTRVVPGNRL
jgi:hypothetical protein